jgi:hypothetical protein
MKQLVLALFTIAFLLTFPAAKANVIIIDPTGSFSVGIGPDGELYDNTTGVGFLRLSDGYDPLASGRRDSWGIATFFGSAYADYQDYGTLNILGTVATSTPSTASYLTTTTVGVTVGQSYSFAAPNILRITETITNIGVGPTSFSFQRDINWDVSPTESNENTFASSRAAVANGVSYSGFENPDAGTRGFSSVCSSINGCNQQGDVGAGIRLFSPFDLSVGQSFSFDFYYAISQLGQSAVGLDTQMTAANSFFNIMTQSSENGDFPNLGANSAALGFGPATPEPSSVALLATALAGFGAYAWRRRKTV